MSALPVREALIAQLHNLSDDEVKAVLEFIDSMKAHRDVSEYDEANDPLAGFFSGPADLAERSEEILRQEFGLYKPQDTKDK
jgi:hypothetical protein